MVYRNGSIIFVANYADLIDPISITSLSSISALGSTAEEIWQHYLNNTHCITNEKIGNTDVLVAMLPDTVRKAIQELRNSDVKYKKLDDTVLFAMYVSQEAMKQAGWKQEDHFGVNIGSSRGATHLFEKYHQEFIEKGKTATLSSPTTTLGNISSWVAHHLQSRGPEISHSITCSTALHAVLNAVAWIQSGLTKRFLVGGTEASLTEFTIAQMKAMKIYASTVLSTGAKENVTLSLPSRKTGGAERSYPCRAFDLSKKKNTMVLGEAAASACLEKGAQQNALAKIIGIGYATEVLEHNTSISAEGDCFQRSMQMAMKGFDLDTIDAIVMHAPGTIKGDTSEYEAIKKVFCNKTPFLTTNKWKLGHTFGASGMLSLELAILMLQHQQTISVPFAMEQHQPTNIQNILVNAVGFGGNAVSILLTK